MLEHNKEPKQMTPQELLEAYTQFTLLPSSIRTEKEQIFLTLLREEILKRMK